MESRYSKRYIANIVFEADTPLKVGSSDIDMLQDSPVQKDFNDLPMVLGTSIAGVLRQAFDTKVANDLFGDEANHKKDHKGSRVIISNALLCDENMEVIERLIIEKSTFLKLFETLPIREHTAITHRGVARENGKFDEEVVYKGSRFKCRVEFIADENDAEYWYRLLQALNSKLFRLGGGTTKGFGNIKILHALSTYDLFDVTSTKYQEHSSSLNTTFSTPLTTTQQDEVGYTTYTLSLQPDDFFMFGSGFGDDEADITPVYEKVIKYNEQNPQKSGLSEEMVLIPASSIKGALAHRTAFHYNKMMLEAGEDHTKVGEANEAVKAIFGHKKELDNEHNEIGQKGKLLLSDCFLEKSGEKLFDHVAIDRFTGGAIDGALFQEKTLCDVESFSIEILLKHGVNTAYQEAFEAALLDVTTGMLPLGGATTKGHGVFSGTVWRDGEKL